MSPHVVIVHCALKNDSRDSRVGFNTVIFSAPGGRVSAAWDVALSCHEAKDSPKPAFVDVARSVESEREGGVRMS